MGLWDEGFEVVGEDEGVVGALLQRANLAPANRSASQLRVVRTNPSHVATRPKWMGPAGRPQGVSVPDEEMDYLPFPALRMTSVTGPNGSMVALPQRPFRGERVIASATYIPAAASPFSVSDLTVVSPAMYVGAIQVGVTQGDAPLSVWSSQSFGVRLSWPDSGQGARIYIPIIYQGGAIPAGDTVLVNFTVVGRSVR